MYIIAIFFFIANNAVAQIATQTKAPVSSNNKQVNSSDSLKKAMSDLKLLFGGKRDTITITVSNVDYDDSDLSNLKENLKTLKGAKFIDMQYKSDNATLAVSYKGNSTILWDNLPPLTKKPFKLQEVNDKNISLKLRSAKASQ